MNDSFTNNPLWHEQIGKIYALLERVKISEEQSKDVLHLRRNNRILSIGSTTAIEGNRLTVQQVFDVINGKTVFAPLHDIKEVKNAFAAYEQIADLNPYNVDDFLKAHRLITENLVVESGQFRTVGVAVVNSNREILHSGADFKQVPALIEELFEWGKATDSHALLKSSAMHFMIEHIHPFRDGNGRIGRLWQTLVLTKWNEIFEWLPVETMIYHNQTQYYEALQQSHNKDAEVDCRPFIDFMLDVIENAMYQYIDKSENKNGGLNGGLNFTEREIIALIKENTQIKSYEIAQKLMKPIRTIDNNIRQLKGKGIISRVGSKKTGYWQIN
ncbi:MAG: Fic family protein [Prevotellaceae bacterium]|nr:Fic family protein [Prevotellaceae bacterium]